MSLQMTPDQALTLLESPAGPVTDALWRHWMAGRPDDDLLYLLGAAAMMLGVRHGKTEAQVHADLTGLAILQEQAEQSARASAENN